MRWTKEALGARVDAIASEHQGDAFVAAVEQFSRQALDQHDRALLYDVLMERANLRDLVTDAAAARRRQGWTRRMLEGQIGRRRPPRAPG